MNRSKKPLSRNALKKVEKEVRLAQSSKYATPSAEAKTLEKKATAELYKKRKKIPSKRTTPAEHMPRTSAPKHTLIEGKRWIQTTEKQTLLSGKRLTKRLSKKKG